VATERQIAANRRNARKSTGPRSSAAKRRTRRNSYRHGLTASVFSNAERTKRIERLARKIAGKATDVVMLEYARDAAQAEFDLARIRRVKVALIERMSALGELQAPQAFQSVSDVKEFLKALDEGKAIVPVQVDAAATLPATEPERLAAAVRRALPELRKLDRYERRAALLRERSVRAIKDRTYYLNDLVVACSLVRQCPSNWSHS
jgi:hypothetical protein